jgi:hypothetical protein
VSFLVLFFSLRKKNKKQNSKNSQPTLRVHQKLPEQLLLARGGAPREADACGAAIVEVSCFGLLSPPPF